MPLPVSAKLSKIVSNPTGIPENPCLEAICLDEVVGRNSNHRRSFTTS
jgi:hypothetical protein